MPSEENISIRARIHKEIEASDLPLAGQRRAWIDCAATQSTYPGVSLREETVAGVPCLWLTRAESPKRSTILYIHGGGLVDGAIATHRELVSRIVGLTGYQAVMVGYRLAPEHRFPAALDDTLSVYEALSASGQIDPRRCAIGGDSSGGGLAVAAMARLVKEAMNVPV